jgi:hypothetical protein
MSGCCLVCFGSWRWNIALASIVGLLVTAAAFAQREYKSGKVWPEPKVVEPGFTDNDPPSDAIVLFDGKDLSKWEGGDQWKIENGVATVRGGSIQTKQPFGDCQLHIEWASPEKVSGSGQGRGNSGVYLMGHYEIQILDSYQNHTYPDGSAGSLYKQSPPLVNVSRKPGEWQSYDIIFTAPRFKDGKLAKPGYVTVLHNGVLVQNHFEIEGTSAWDSAPAYEPHAEKLPLHLQNHGNPVRFRNIWIREL